MGWTRNRDFRLEVVIPSNALPQARGYFEHHYYKAKEMILADDGVLVVLEGPFKPLEYSAFKAIVHFKLTEVFLEYQGQYSKNPKKKGRMYFVQ